MFVHDAVSYVHDAAGYDSFDLSDIEVYLYVFAHPEAFYALFSPFKYIIIIFEAILTQFLMHI